MLGEIEYQGDRDEEQGRDAVKLNEDVGFAAATVTHLRSVRREHDDRQGPRGRIAPTLVRVRGQVEDGVRRVMAHVGVWCGRCKASNLNFHSFWMNFAFFVKPEFNFENCIM